MNSQDKIKWLSRCRDIDRKIQSKCDEKSVWMARATKITPTLSDMPSGGKKENKIESAIEKMEQIEDEIDLEIDELVKVKTEVKAVISSVQSSTYREVLERRYIRGQKWEKIAVEMNYDYRYTLKLHGFALQAVEVDTKRHPIVC